MTPAPQLHDRLVVHQAQDRSILLVTSKKRRHETYVSTPEILHEIPGFGWIDGIRRTRDTDCTMQLLSPRKTQFWAKRCKDRVAKSMKSGLWTQTEDVDALIIPDDLAAGPAGLPLASPGVDAFAPAYRRQVLRGFKQAKTHTPGPNGSDRSRRAAEAEDCRQGKVGFNPSPPHPLAFRIIQRLQRRLGPHPDPRHINLPA